jgi:hypothetical protein
MQRRSQIPDVFAREIVPAIQTLPLSDLVRATANPTLLLDPLKSFNSVMV